VPNKRGLLISRGAGICEMALNDYKMMERIKEIIIKNRAKIYTEEFYSTLNIGRE